MNHQSQNGKTDEATSERCMRYLLGELSADETATFEQSLGSSAELGDELQRQSELLWMVSQATFDPPPVTSQATSDSFAKWTEAAVALAACLLVAFIGWNLISKSNATSAIQEDVLIAQAWADTDAIALGLSSADEIELEMDNDFEIESQDVDDSLSWVVTAVESGVSIDG